MANPAAPDAAPSGEGGARTAADPDGTRAGLAILAMVVAVLLAAFAGTALSGEPAPSEDAIEDVTARAEACDLGEWPVDAEGPHPAYPRNATSGVYVWVDRSGWHVRNLTGEEVDLSVAAIGRPALVVSAAGEDTEGETLSEPASQSFLLPGDDPDVGVDFTILCEFVAVTFDLTTGGTPLPASQIHLGRTTTPDANPFVVEREPGE